MNEQIQYITKLAAQYKIYAEQSEELFAAVNELSETAIKMIYDEYGGGERFQPVNLLRAEIARQMLDGANISKETVEEIKRKIRAKDLNYFGHLSAEFLSGLENYAVGKRDWFANWQKDWNVFHTFFYRGKTKETTQIYLEQICKQLLNDLQLNDYTYHWVDFQGASNYGAFWCWLALYPQNKSSHKEARQFFLKFKPEIEVGRTDGSNVETQEHKTQFVQNYEQIIKVFQQLKTEIVRFNGQVRNYFKFAPGEQAKYWDRFKLEGIAALSYNNFEIRDISNINSREELNLAVGFPAESQSNETWNLWLFKTANIGDVVFASRGVSTCLGIGLIESEYYFDEEAEDYQHRRKVNWITDKVYQYTADSFQDYKTLFRFDNF